MGKVEIRHVEVERVSRFEEVEIIQIECKEFCGGEEAVIYFELRDATPLLKSTKDEIEIFCMTKGVEWLNERTPIWLENQLTNPLSEEGLGDVNKFWFYCDSLYVHVVPDAC